LSINTGTQLSLISDELKDRFFADYGKTAQQACDEAAESGVDIKNNTQYLKYNVYLVDNDILKEEVWVSAEMLWDQTGGKNQFLQAAKCWITPNQ
tara:strand:+ start:230 stop:514 length:285 start_codon:yes stop_codon:yes gene_type:complete